MIEQEASRDHTELMLKHFGAEIVSTMEGSHGRKIALTGQPELQRRRCRGACRSVLGCIPDRGGAGRRGFRP